MTDTQRGGVAALQNKTETALKKLLNTKESKPRSCRCCIVGDMVVSGLVVCAMRLNIVAACVDLRMFTLATLLVPSLLPERLFFVPFLLPERHFFVPLLSLSTLVLACSVSVFCVGSLCLVSIKLYYTCFFLSEPLRYV